MEYLAGIVIALGVSISATVVGLLSLALMVNVGGLGTRNPRPAATHLVDYGAPPRTSCPLGHIPHPCG